MIIIAAEACFVACRTCMASLTAVLRLTWLRCHSTSDLLVCPSRANLYSCRVYLSVYKLMIQLVLMFRLPIAILHLVPCQGKGPATVPCVLVGCSFSYAGMYGIGHPCSIYICKIHGLKPLRPCTRSGCAPVYVRSSVSEVGGEDQRALLFGRG